MSPAIPKVHFFAVADGSMDKLACRFVQSLDFYSGVSYHMTIMTPEWDPMPRLPALKNCEFVTYRNEKNFVPFWAGAIRFEMEAKADVCFLVDLDMFVVNSLAPLAIHIEQQNQIFGCLAKRNCFQGLHLWHNVFNLMGLNIDRLYVLNDSTLSPIYLNYGFIGLKKELMPQMAPVIRHYTEKVQFVKSTFRGQIALTCAICDLKAPVTILNETYNFSSHMPEIPDIKIIHYHQERKDIAHKRVRLDFPLRSRVMTILGGSLQKKLFL